MWKGWRWRYQTALRYKLIALVLLPLLLAMVVSLGYTLYWLNGFTQETLLSTARSDLALAQRALLEWQEGYQLTVRQLEESKEFRNLLAQGDPTRIQSFLQGVREQKGFMFLHITGVAGNWLYEPRAGAARSSKPSPLTDRAARGLAGASLEVFNVENLQREGARLVNALGLARGEPAAGAPAGGQRALVMRVVQPIAEAQGRSGMVLDGAVLVNHNEALLEFLHERASGASLSPTRADPIVTLFLHDFRIAATGNAVDMELPTQLEPRLAEGNRVWAGREQHGRRAFISAYGPLFDVHGQRIGSLHAAFREDSFRASQYRAAGLLLLLFGVATALAGWLAVRGMRSVFQPIERMTAVVRATQAGHDQRIGAIGSSNELGELARQFDAMLDLLQERNRELQRAAQVLEDKVTERTQQLAEKNAQLRKTITLLEQTREQLVLAEKLSALGQMSAGIAHEINNPAAVILGNLEVLTAELGDAAKPVSREIDLIAQQVDRIRHIVTGLLQFARSEPASGAIEDVDVNWLIDDVRPLVEHGLRARGIVLETELAATRGVPVNVFDLEQVLVNLIGNAANAVADGGRIEIGTRDWEQGGVVIAVRDDGAGIPEDQLRHIFDPFFTGRPGHGMGLGLSVSYGLVQRYGGRITVASRVGMGSTFEVWLPAHTGAPMGSRRGERGMDAPIASSPSAEARESRDSNEEIRHDAQYG
jgi:two-component system NtrC family sensor kinase